MMSLDSRRHISGSVPLVFLMSRSAPQVSRNSTASLLHARHATCNAKNNNKVLSTNKGKKKVVFFVVCLKSSFVPVSPSLFWWLKNSVMIRCIGQPSCCDSFRKIISITPNWSERDKKKLSSGSDLFRLSVIIPEDAAAWRTVLPSACETKVKSQQTRRTILLSAPFYATHLHRYRATSRLRSTFESVET